MHKIGDTSDAILARVQRRRGAVNPFRTIEGKRTAHIVVDMQTGFLTPLFSNVSVAREIVSGINEISAAVRRAGGLVVYLMHTVTEQAVRDWSNHYDYFSRDDQVRTMIDTFTPGKAGHDLWHEMDVRPEDLRVDKLRYSAFVPGSSDLHDILTQREIDTLIVSGTVTNVCCESTARDASMMNYKVLFVSDATAAHTDEEHNSALSALTYIFADVRDRKSVIGLLDASGSRSP
jgi:ureidoacrylate peracid hydrolase